MPAICNSKLAAALHLQANYGIDEEENRFKAVLALTPAELDFCIGWFSRRGLADLHHAARLKLFKELSGAAASTELEAPTAAQEQRREPSAAKDDKLDCAPLQDRFEVKRGGKIVYARPSVLTDAEIEHLIAKFSAPGLREPERWLGQARALACLLASRRAPA